MNEDWRETLEEAARVKLAALMIEDPELERIIDQAVKATNTTHGNVLRPLLSREALTAEGLRADLNREIRLADEEDQTRRENRLARLRENWEAEIDITG